jgi:bifunctional non-homologous end joining protein LigD
MNRFGYSGLPKGTDDAAFLDGLVEKGHTAFELSFTDGFPWKIDRCETFGRLAAERDIKVSIHAPYFAVLTVEDEERSSRCVSAIEHTMKLGKAVGASMICVHPGNRHGRDAEELVDLIAQRIDRIAPKVEHLGVGLGLETTGKDGAFGTLGDLALITDRFPFVRPYVDWAHLQAISRGGLADKDGFAAVFGFLAQHFPAWMINPLQCQFSEVQYGDTGEIRHLPYGQGTLRIGNLVDAAREIGTSLIVISEAREPESTDAMLVEMSEAEQAPVSVPSGRTIGSGEVEFPDAVRVVAAGSGFAPIGTDNPLVLSNLDKPFFPDGYTKGDLIQYYATIAPTLLPHLADRAIVMARYPDGWDGEWFYEKQAPGHTPDWLPLAPVFSEHRGEPIDFVTAPNREALMWLASIGCIEIHPWLNRLDHENSPDFAIFDLDPAEGATWDQVVAVAKLLKVALDGLGLTGYPKTSGATGIHVYVPLDPVYEYRRVRKLVETVGRLLEAANPDDITMQWDIATRGPKVFIDHNQNVGGKTIASVYSVRPRPGAPVSTPILWEEVGIVHPGDFTIVTIWERLKRYGDLFAPVLQAGQRLENAEEKLGL